MMASSTTDNKTATRKRGLGRGLDALIEKAEPKPDETVRTLPIDRLHPNRFQPRTRFDDEAIEDLAASIRTQGIIQPLVVTAEGDGYAIIAGERRWRAARKAGLEAVPVVVRQVADDRELLELALVENLQRSDLNPIEEAEAYAALQEKFGLSQEEVAARVGKARTTVTNSLRLLRLPDDVLDLLREGRLTAGQARPLLGLQDQEEQIRLADSAVRDGLSARDLERLAAAPREEHPKSKKPDRPVEVHTAAAEERLTRRLQTRVEIMRQGKGGQRGQLRIHFHSEEELMRLFDVLIERGENR
jgi:ParB family chromosome partitioning protein